MFYTYRFPSHEYFRWIWLGQSQRRSGLREMPAQGGGGGIMSLPSLAETNLTKETSSDTSLSKSASLIVSTCPLIWILPDLSFEALTWRFSLPFRSEFPMPQNIIVRFGSLGSLLISAAATSSDWGLNIFSVSWITETFENPRLFLSSPVSCWAIERPTRYILRSLEIS